MMQPFAARTVCSLRQRLADAKFAFVPARNMLALLGDVSPSAVDSFAAMWDKTTIQTDETGRDVYPHKKSLLSYFEMKTTPLDGGTRSASHDRPGRYII